MSLTDDLKRARAAIARQPRATRTHLAEAFRVKTQCADCGYQSMDIYPSQRAMCPCNNCTGAMVAYEHDTPEGKR